MAAPVFSNMQILMKRYYKLIYKMVTYYSYFE